LKTSRNKNFTRVQWQHLKQILGLKRDDLTAELRPLAALLFRNGAKKSAVKAALLESAHRSMTSCSMDRAEDFDVNLLSRSNALMAKRTRGLVNRESAKAVRWIVTRACVAA
jgi:hypothetical protein